MPEFALPGGKEAGLFTFTPSSRSFGDAPGGGKCTSSWDHLRTILEEVDRFEPSAAAPEPVTGNARHQLRPGPSSSLAWLVPVLSLFFYCHITNLPKTQDSNRFFSSQSCRLSVQVGHSSSLGRAYSHICGHLRGYLAAGRARAASAGMSHLCSVWSLLP